MGPCRGRRVQSGVKDGANPCMDNNKEPNAAQDAPHEKKD